MRIITLYLIMCCGLIKVTQAQFILPLLRLNDQSPKSITGHQIGVTDVMIEYYSPSVKGRKIWGSLVPYGRTWRAGANEITTMSFEHDVVINNQVLPKGKYGFIILPQENEFTLIFTKNTTAWGNFSYKEDDAVLKVSVKPEPSPMHYEWLKYEFNTLTDSTAQAALCWEKLKVPFIIKTNTKENVLRILREEWLTSSHRFDWIGWWYAASYCYDHNINLTEALTWINRSVAVGPNFTNLKLKADILSRLNQQGESRTTMEKALRIGTIYDIERYVIQLVSEKRASEALVVSKRNAEKYPDLWEVNRGLAFAYSAIGDYSRALKHAKLVLPNVTGGQITFWEGAIKKLERKQDFTSN